MPDGVVFCVFHGGNVQAEGTTSVHHSKVRSIIGWLIKIFINL